jgi:hypothetical protein
MCSNLWRRPFRVSRQENLEQTILEIVRNPYVAHKALFRHRHPNVSPIFHRELVEAFHSDHPRVEALVFRGGSKTTLAEETMIVKAVTRQFRNGIITAENEQRAAEKIRSIKNELETNIFIEELFGTQQGEIWGETKLLLSNGTMIQGYGRGQSLRGSKHFDARPDWCLIDDIEDEDSVLTPDAIRKVFNWYWKVVLPALDTPKVPIRVLATPLAEEALAMQLSKLDEFKVIRVPIEYVDTISGERRSSWPDKFPLSLIDKMKQDYTAAGELDSYAQEYMLEIADVKQKPFLKEMFKYEPLIRTYHPVYAVYDPARTVKKTSATTGYVVASWQANRLIVWEAGAKLWKPDEIINDMFRVGLAYEPIAIGVEEDGLNEFIMQPLRQAQVTRGILLPIRALKAPKGKIDFIRSLQPFFNAKEIIFAGDPEAFTELSKQLLNFPSGNIDAPNALAYFLKMRPGQPVFDNFTNENIEDDIHVGRNQVYLCLNAIQGLTTGVAVIFASGRLSIVADYIREGSPGDTLEGILREVKLNGSSGSPEIVIYAPAQHFVEYDTIGLRAGARHIGARSIRKGGDPTLGREEIRMLLARRSGGYPAVSVSARASWTLRAFSGGYARTLDKQGAISDEPAPGPYATLMQALESFVAASVFREEDDTGLNYEYSADGRRYLSARG